jgi:beta-fructofuranosidase
VQLDSCDGLAVARCAPLPFNVRLTLRVSPSDARGVYGLRLRSDGDYDRAVVLLFRPAEAIVELGNTAIYGVCGLDRPFSVEVICREDLIDVCIDGRRCVVNRCPEGRGEQLFFFAQGTAVCYDPISIQPLL